MFLFSVSGHMDGFSKGYSNRFGWIDFTEVLEQTTDAPGVRLQRNGHNRQMGLFCQFDAECIELRWIEVKASRCLGENENGYILFQTMRPLLQNRPEIFSWILAIDHDRMKTVDGVL